MLIDWFTVGAQLLNFIILVGLMKRFLYQPVLDAIDTREQKISAELADAAEVKKNAHQQQDEFERKSQAFDEQRAQLLRQAREDADAERERLQQEAREAAEAAKARHANALSNETQSLHAEISRRAQQQVLDISRRVLCDLAGISIEQRACEVFIHRLQALEGAALIEIGTALKSISEKDPAMLRSAFELPVVQQAAIQAALDASIGQPVPLKFESKPELVSGIELSARGQKLAWSISGYLDALASDLEQRLCAKDSV